MDSPLELSFHNMEPSDALKARVQDNLVRLEQYFGHIISCRVTISLPHKSQKAVGNQPDVRVVLRVPGKEVVVSRKMNNNGHKKADNDPYAVVDEAFATAQQQLKDWRRTNQTEARQKNVIPTDA
jgi:ribosomal subunit interface protein